MTTMIDKGDIQPAGEICNLLRDACESLLSFDEFFVLAALTDRSYEEGIRSAKFRESVDSMAAAGIQAAVIEQLREGVNGNLVQLLDGTKHGYVVRRNKWKGADVIFNKVGEIEVKAIVEIKVVYDCTFYRQYAMVAADRDKLLMALDENTELYQIVFFSELPCYSYPKARWYGKECHGRSSYLQACGIAAQFAELQTHLKCQPTWPANGPITRLLQSPAERLSHSDILRWFESICQVKGDWKFDPAAQLKNAAVGVALWKYER